MSAGDSAPRFGPQNPKREDKDIDRQLLGFREDATRPHPEKNFVNEKEQES